METLRNYKQIMKDQEAVALATSIGEEPNVRIINFIMKEEAPGIIYFASFKDNNKTKEFAQNDKVAFTTIPNENTANIRVHSARVKISDQSIHDLADALIAKIPDYKEIIDFGADQLLVYEVHFSKATVVLDYKNISVLEF